MVILEHFLGQSVCISGAVSEAILDVGTNKNPVLDSAGWPCP